LDATDPTAIMQPGTGNFPLSGSGLQPHEAKQVGAKDAKTKMKVNILISAELEFPDHMAKFVDEAIEKNFILHMTSMISPPFILRYTHLQKADPDA